MCEAYASHNAGCLQYKLMILKCVPTLVLLFMFTVVIGVDAGDVRYHQADV